MDKVSDQKREEFEVLTRPLMEWLRANYHPHVTVIVDSGHAELLEGLMTARINDPA